VISETPKFELVADWITGPTIPTGTADVAVDNEDRIYAFARGSAPHMSSASAVVPAELIFEHPYVAVYSKNGDALSSWGHDIFTGRPHAIVITEDRIIYTVEDKGCAVRKFSLDGELLSSIGPTGMRSDTGADWDNAPNTVTRLQTIRDEGGPPYNHPTGIAVGNNGDLYVSDGYANCKIHRFSANGDLKESFGRSGSGPGEFRLPHQLLIHDDTIYLCDRENDRIQLFNLDFEFLGAWTSIHRPNTIAVGPDGWFYVGESRVPVGRRSFVHGPAKKEMPSRVSILDSAGTIVGALSGIRDAAAPHGICLDSAGDLYVADAGRLEKYARM
jgi:DNA-binding beta-propeller fold protein YncE